MGGKPAREMVEYIAVEAIKQRRIALPTKRIVWYCRWLGLKAKPGTIVKILTQMVLDGKLKAYHEGKVRYFKLNRK